MKTENKVAVERAALLETLCVICPDDPTALANMPTLLDLLMPRWRDGHQTRQAGKLTIRADAAAWRIGLECPTEGVQTFMVVESLVGLLEQFELHLATGKARWQMTYAAQKKAGRPIV